MSLLERYIAVATVKALGLVSAGLTSLFSLLEFVDQLHDVGKGHYRLIDALFYVLLTAPARLLQLMPAAMLFSCLFALGALATRGELTAMRAGGLSPGRIVGSVLKLAGCAVVALFLLAQFVIPPAQQLAQAERASRVSSSEAVRSGNSFWAAGDHQFLNVRRFDNGNIPSDLYLYEFAANGELQRLIQADHAEVRPDGTWLLEDVSIKRFTGNRSGAQGIPRSADGATRGNRSAAEGIPRSADGATRGNRSAAERIPRSAGGATRDNRSSPSSVPAQRVPERSNVRVWTRSLTRVSGLLASCRRCSILPVAGSRMSIPASLVPIQTRPRASNTRARTASLARDCGSVSLCRMTVKLLVSRCQRATPPSLTAIHRSRCASSII